MKEESENNKLIKVKAKEKKANKFIEIIKKRWIVNGTKTIILIATIIAVFIAINLVMQSLELTPIDLSQEKLFTLTDESKEKVKGIEKDVKIYFIEYAEDDSTIDLAKQYKKANERITTEVVKANDRPDLVQKYGIETGSTGIIVECGERYKVLTSEDLVTYDTSTYETINIAEEKLTAAICSVTTEKVPKVYFLSGYSNISLENGLQFLNIYLQNEVNEVESVDVLTTGKVPDDCSTLVVVAPSKDLDELASNAIIEYINNGGNILWFQSALTQNTEMPNINKILAMYGINPFKAGIIRETDTTKMLANSPDLILPDAQSTDVTKKIQSAGGVTFIDATKINTMEEEKLTELKVEQTNLLTTSEKAYFRTNFIIQTDEPQGDDETGTFTVGQMMTKTLADANEETGEPAKTSKLVIYGEAYFISDVPLSQSSSVPVIGYRQNKDLALNSIAYLANREQDITARKNTGVVTYQATEAENIIILIIIFTVPIVIMIAGIVVWIIRRRRK